MNREEIDSNRLQRRHFDPGMCTSAISSQDWARRGPVSSPYSRRLRWIIDITIYTSNTMFPKVTTALTSAAPSATGAKTVSTDATCGGTTQL